MRLRTLIAPTMGQAMDMLRRELGDDAIIVSTENTDHGIKIVAALEEAEEEIPSIGAVIADPLGPEPVEDPIDLVHEALLVHGLPNRLLEKLIDASFIVGADDPMEALIGALDRVYGFDPLTPARGPNQPLMLVGAPGAGKTVTIAKLAARAVFAKRKVRVITTDTVRAGGIEQLEAFARVMRLTLHIAETDRQLTRLVDAATPDELILIDTPGINPFSPRDLAEVTSLVKAVPAEPVLVMAAGGDVVDSMEQAQRFATLGTTRLIVTRLDMVRRLGSMLAAADAATLAFCDCSTTPAVADGLNPIDPQGLAKMLMPDTATTTAQPATRGLRS